MFKEGETIKIWSDAWCMFEEGGQGGGQWGQMRGVFASCFLKENQAKNG